MMQEPPYDAQKYQAQLIELQKTEGKVTAMPEVTMALHSLTDQVVRLDETCKLLEDKLTPVRNHNKAVDPKLAADRMSMNTQVADAIQTQADKIEVLRDGLDTLLSQLEI